MTERMKNSGFSLSSYRIRLSKSEMMLLLWRTAAETAYYVFTEDGLKGEIETTLPIEKISVSNQGIVSAILKNENTPRIISYDATGNILVEQQITLGIHRISDGA